MSKLVRDLIPSIIAKNDGIEPEITVVGWQDLEKAVREKIAEEITELLTASDDGLLGEAGDVFEIVAKLVSVRLGVGPEEALVLIDRARKEKLEKRGGFEENFIWHPQK